MRLPRHGGHEALQPLECVCGALCHRQRLVLRQAPTTFAPGTYVVTATAAAPDGRSSASAKVKFWVLLGARTR